MTHATRLIATVAVVTGFAGCEDATGPSQAEGRVEAAAVGDASTAPDSASSPSTSSESDQAEGTVDFSARVFLWTDGDGWIEVTEGVAHSASVSASGSAEANTFASSRMNARSYTKVRVVFEDVRANVTGGIELGAGGILQGEVRVGADGSAGPVVVEREIDVRVNAGATSRLIVDLNSSAWLTHADVETMTVARSEFESAVRVVTGG